MYKINVSYRINTNGMCWAHVKVLESDDGFDRSVLNADLSTEMTEEMGNWEEVEKQIKEILEQARGKIQARRESLRTIPKDYELII